MADVWYEPKGEAKAQSPFSFDECIGLMVDTVQAYGHELVNVRIQSAAMRHMMHVLESHIAGEVEEDDNGSLDGHEEVPLLAYIHTAQTIAKKMYRPEITTFENLPDLKKRVDEVKAHLNATPRPSTADGNGVSKSELDIIRKSMTEMSFQMEEQKQALEDQKALTKQIVDELNQRISDQGAMNSPMASPTNEASSASTDADLAGEAIPEGLKKQLEALKKEVKRLSSELEKVKKNSIPEPKEIKAVTTTQSPGDGLSKEETIKIVSEALQTSSKNIVQQATQAAEITTSQAINSALKQATQSSQEANDKAQQALKEVAEFKEKEKMNELMASRDRTAAKNAAKSSTKAEAAAKKAEQMAAEVADKSYAEIDHMKNELMRFKNSIDRCEQDIIKINEGMTKNSFMGAIGAVTGSSPQPPPQAAAPPPQFDIKDPEAQASLQKLDSASRILDSPKSSKEAIDIIGLELWKVREEVLQLASKGNADIAKATSEMEEQNKRVLEKCSENATRAAEAAIVNWQAEQVSGDEDADEDDKLLSLVIPEAVAAEMKKYEAKHEESTKALVKKLLQGNRHKTDGSEYGQISWGLDGNDEEGEDNWEGGSWGGGQVVTGGEGSFIAGIGAGEKQPKKVNLDKARLSLTQPEDSEVLDKGENAVNQPRKLNVSIDESKEPITTMQVPKSPNGKISLHSLAHTLVVEERKKRKTMLRGKPDLSNTLMDRIEGLEVQVEDMDKIKQMMIRMEQFQKSMMSKTKVIPTIRAEVQTLQVTTETLVENSGPKTEDLVAAVKKQMEKQMETVYHRLNVLENMGDLYTDFAGGDLEGGEEGEEDEENRKKISPILPPKNIPLREVMLSLRDTAGMSEKKPGEFIWVYDGALESMRNEMRELNEKFKSGFTNLGFRLQQQNNFIGDFEELRGAGIPLAEKTDSQSTLSPGSPNELSTGSSPKSSPPPVLTMEIEPREEVSESSKGSPTSRLKRKASKKKSSDKLEYRTIKDRFEGIEALLADMSASMASDWGEQREKVKGLVDQILTLNGDVGDAKKKLSTLEVDSGMKDELQRVAEQLAELFEKNSGMAQTVSGKADTKSVTSIMAQLSEYAKRSQEELDKLAGASDAKLLEVQEEMRKQLAYELEQALLNMPKGGGETTALLRGYCLSCNQQVPRARPKYPRLLVNPHVRDGEPLHGDNGPIMDIYDGGSVASFDPSLSESIASSQLSHAEKVDVMGGGFRLQPPHERFEPLPKHPPSERQMKQLMKKNGKGNLVMKQKIQREGVGRLQPMLPVPNSNNESIELDFSNNASSSGYGMPSGAGVAPFGRKLMPWEKEGDPMSMSDSTINRR